MKTHLKTGILSTVLVFGIAFSSNVKAQLLPEFGIKGGANFATLNNYEGVETKTGLLAGASVIINIPASPLAIQLEVLYAQYGANIEGSDQIFILDYIQIPVLLKFGFDIPAAPIKPNVFFGPYASFKTKAEAENFTSVNPNYFDENTKDRDYGVVVGAGLDITKLRFDLRYTAGLVEIFKNGADGGKTEQ